ncbi:hypothetical protein [Leucobacter denitrificans]|uniref:Uncharacterized protein n=1 Tax=Leucobacter denitrificans TaxID=683042 RepID=A0A7G9S7C7_9MICO|nr:hypothetical protein [Leucobacter denitrificans]QNN63752.1 hypothetical protein H9L06_05590 [Leucobacter denitrificans]
MTIAAPHEEEVRRALEILERTDATSIERALRTASGSATGFLTSLRATLTFNRSVGSLENALASLDTTVSPEIARAAQATENVWRQIDREFGLLSSAEVAAILGASKDNRAYAAALRKRGALAGIERKNAYVYPGFQLNTTTGTVHTWVAPLLKLATEHNRSMSDALLWMVSPSTYFDGARPVDHLDDAERILSVSARSWGTEW